MWPAELQPMDPEMLLWQSGSQKFPLPGQMWPRRLQSMDPEVLLRQSGLQTFHLPR